MTIDKKIENEKITLMINGRLDTQTAPELEKEVEKLEENCKELILDMTELAYISSAGLRVLLKAQKLMNTKGEMKLINVNESVMEVFEITGFLDILTIA
ncbi:STAS domain-containing protein [Anaerotignum sp.]